MRQQPKYCRACFNTDHADEFGVCRQRLLCAGTVYQPRSFDSVVVVKPGTYLHVAGVVTRAMTEAAARHHVQIRPTRGTN